MTKSFIINLKIDEEWTWHQSWDWRITCSYNKCCKLVKELCGFRLCFKLGNCRMPHIFHVSLHIGIPCKCFFTGIDFAMDPLWFCVLCLCFCGCGFPLFLGMIHKVFFISCFLWDVALEYFLSFLYVHILIIFNFIGRIKRRILIAVTEVICAKNSFQVFSVQLFKIPGNFQFSTWIFIANAVRQL